MPAEVDEEVAFQGASAQMRAPTGSSLPQKHLANGQKNGFSEANSAMQSQALHDEEDEFQQNGTEQPLAHAIFGYGSLIFKPPPYPLLTSSPGYLKGFVRRFAQDSHDHRGTPSKPGRVVTLVTEDDWKPYQRDEPLESGHIWGRVYRIPHSLRKDKKWVKEYWDYLDYREKDGYTKRLVNVFGVDNSSGEEVIIEKDCVVYVGETSNPSFGGGTSMEELANRIVSCKGPSGPNKEYLYNLCEAVNHLCPQSEDVYLNSLEALVRIKESAV